MGNTPAWVGTALVALAVVTGCRKGGGDSAPDRTSAPPASSASAAATSSPPDAAAPDERVASTRSFAHFVKNTLNECGDFTLIAPPGTDQAKLDAFLDSKFGKVKPKDTVSVATSCQEQFADRTPLGSCLLVEKDRPIDAGPAPALSSVVETFFYNVKTMNDDAYMRECLESGGKWSAPSKDDPAAARERLRQRAKGVQDLSDKMNGIEQ